MTVERVALGLAVFYSIAYVGFVTWAVWINLHDTPPPPPEPYRPDTLLPPAPDDARELTEDRRG